MILLQRVRDACAVPLWDGMLVENPIIPYPFPSCRDGTWVEDAEQHDVTNILSLRDGERGGTQHFYQYSIPTGWRKRLLNINSNEALHIKNLCITFVA
jgi:hypothetical protein